MKSPQSRRRPTALSFGQVRRQRRLAGGGHAGAQPAALGRRHRAGSTRGAGGGQDPAPHPTGPARPADPLGPPAGRGRRGLSWRWHGSAALPTSPDPTAGPRKLPGPTGPARACPGTPGQRLASPDRLKPAATPSRSCLQDTTQPSSNRPASTPTRQEFGRRWIQAK